MDLNKLIANPAFSLVIMFAIFYFLLIRPQQQRAKKHRLLINSLKVNDPVVTSGGILGTIIKVKDNSVIIKGIDNNKLEILKTNISYVNEEAREEKNKDAE